MEYFFPATLFQSVCAPTNKKKNGQTLKTYMVKATHPDRNSQRNTHRENRKEKKDLKRVKTGTKKEERSQSNKQT